MIPGTYPPIPLLRSSVRVGGNRVHAELSPTHGIPLQSDTTEFLPSPVFRRADPYAQETAPDQPDDDTPPLLVVYGNGCAQTNSGNDPAWRAWVDRQNCTSKKDDEYIDMKDVQEFHVPDPPVHEGCDLCCMPDQLTDQTAELVGRTLLSWVKVAGGQISKLIFDTSLPAKAASQIIPRIDETEFEACMRQCEANGCPSDE